MGTLAAIRTTALFVTVAILAGICFRTSVFPIVRSAPVRDVEVQRPTPEDLANNQVPRWVKAVVAQRPSTVPRRRYDPMIESIAPDGEENRRRLLWFSRIGPQEFYGDGK